MMKSFAPKAAQFDKGFSAQTIHLNVDSSGRSSSHALSHHDSSRRDSSKMDESRDDRALMHPFFKANHGVLEQL